MQDGIHILLLPDGLGLDGTALGGDADHILGQFGNALRLTAAAQADHIAHMLSIDAFPFRRKRQQRLHRLGAQHHVLRLAGDADLPLTVGDDDLQLRFQQADILIERAKEIDGLLHSFDPDALFQLRSLLRIIPRPQWARFHRFVPNTPR